MTSHLLDFQNNIDKTTNSTYGTRNASITLQQPLILNSNGQKYFRVNNITISPEIPNVYSYGNYDNTTIKLSKDGGTTWIIGKLPNGVYTITMIQDCINNICSDLGWYTSISDTPFTLSYNPATKLIYCKINSSKLLNVGQFCIDFSVSQMYKMLGYDISACTFITDGIHASPNEPLIDSQGTYVTLEMSCIQNTRNLNGIASNILARIPLISGSTEIVFPSGSTGLISPVVPALIPNYISSYDVKIKNGNGDDCVFLYGNVIMSIEIIDR